MKGKTKSFIFEGNDFFVAIVDSGHIRIGMIGDRSIDLPPGHKFFNDCLNLKNEEETENLFDILVENGLIIL